MGRHASPRRTASAGAALAPEDRYLQNALQLDSSQLTHQRSGLWGVESNPSRQESVIARAESPPRRQKSDNLGPGSSPQRQKSGILRTASSGSSLRGQESHSGHAHKSPARAPSRLKDSSTEAEVHYASAGRNQSPVRESSAEEEEQQRLRRQPARSLVKESSTDTGDEQSDHRRSPRDLPKSQHSNATQPQLLPQHQHYHTAEKYMSRARVREALSPRRKLSHTQHYAAKARILDLHDNCTLADEQQNEPHSSCSPRRHPARQTGQGGAQVIVTAPCNTACSTLRGAQSASSLSMLQLCSSCKHAQVLRQRT